MLHARDIVTHYIRLSEKRVIEVKVDEAPAMQLKIQESGIMIIQIGNALIAQAFVEELYKFRNLGKPSDVNATVTILPDKRKT